jgi:hypothetical protein
MQAPFSSSMTRHLQRPLALGALFLLLLPLAAGLLHTHRHEVATGRVLAPGSGDSDQQRPCESTHLHRGSSPHSDLCPVCLLHRVGSAAVAGPAVTDAGLGLAGTVASAADAVPSRPDSYAPPSRAPPSA